MARHAQSQPRPPCSISREAASAILSEVRLRATRPTSLLQGRAKFAEPALFHLCLRAFQDRYDSADAAARHILRRPGDAVFGVEMTGLHKFIMVDASGNDFGDCCVVDRVDRR